MEDDWDLQAVVRSCCNNRNSSAANYSEDRPPFEPRKRDQSFFQELKLDYYLHKPENNSSLNLLHISAEQQISLQPQNPFLSASNASKSLGGSRHNPTPRSKRRKTAVMKRVCHVAAENLSSDEWSWRKYGQKPIKGSPYPRGYYRCSTSKGCMARKQVERNRSDPKMFVVTYTAEHNHPVPTHRSSVAGTTKSPPKEGEASMVEEDEDFRRILDSMEVEEDGGDFFFGLEDFTAAEGYFPVSCGG